MEKRFFTCSSSFSFMGGVGKKVIQNSNLDVRNMFAGSLAEL
jgi:hypothetical protein